MLNNKYFCKRQTPKSSINAAHAELRINIRYKNDGFYVVWDNQVFTLFVLSPVIVSGMLLEHHKLPDYSELQGAILRQPLPKIYIAR